LNKFGYPAAKVRPSQGSSIATIEDLLQGIVKEVNPTAEKLWNCFNANFFPNQASLAQKRTFIGFPKAVGVGDLQMRDLLCKQDIDLQEY
jgi:hypothetical protein